MSSVFVHAYEMADRVIISCRGIAPGMRYSIEICRVSLPRTGPNSLDDLAEIAAHSLLWETGRRAGVEAERLREIDRDRGDA